MTTLQIISDKIEEKILYLSLNNGLWVGKRHLNHCTTMSGFTRYLDGTILDSSNDPNYINIDINIDGYTITFYTHKDIRRNTLHFFHYNSENRFDNGEKFHYDLYLVADDVLDDKSHYTSELMERKFKIQKIKDKMVGIV